MKRRPSKKNGKSSSPQKIASGQRNILSMFRHQSQGEGTKEFRSSTSEMSENSISFASSDKNDTLKKRRISSPESVVAHEEDNSEGVEIIDLDDEEDTPNHCDMTKETSHEIKDGSLNEDQSSGFSRGLCSQGNAVTPFIKSEQKTDNSSNDGTHDTRTGQTQASCQMESALVDDDDDDFKDVLDSLSGEDKEVKDEYRMPYYLENFLLIIDTVLNDDYYRSLFNDQDLFYISIFQSLSVCCQKLYVRLIQRRYRWLCEHKIQYPRISSDLRPVLSDLVCAGFLLDASAMTDLEDVLIAMPAPDVKALAKTLKLNIISVQKEDLIKAILKHSRHGGIGAFFGNRGANNTTFDMILKRAKDLLGSCYKLDPAIRSVFMRAMILFGLHRTRGDEEDALGGQHAVFQMLMSSLGQIKYPEYTVHRESKIFKDRDSFLSFVSALQIEHEIIEALESKNYDEAEVLFKTATKDKQQLMAEHLRYDQLLPEYLRAYTAGAVYVRIMSLGVELLQFKRQYQEAVQLLEELIEQDVYHMEYRGRWFDRLALNLDHHLKKHEKALDTIKMALHDDSIRTGHRLSLYQRADKICHMACNKKTLLQRWTEFEADVYSNIKQAPKVYIQGTKLACGQQGPLYISKEGDDVTLLTRVEDVALSHYKAQGYSQGLHGEGGTFTFLLALYMWDIIFMDGVADTFYNPYQICPLDWASDHFYHSRKQFIDKRLAQIHDANSRRLEKMLEKSWEEHENTLCVGVNWQRFTDVEQAKSFVRCLGGTALSGILERLAKSMRYVGGGLPDLTVWNPETKIFKMVEVKGPGDRLSTKQILWLDYLMNLGISAEVCHVQAISSRKLNS